MLLFPIYLTEVTFLKAELELLFLISVINILPLLVPLIIVRFSILKAVSEPCIGLHISAKIISETVVRTEKYSANIRRNLLDIRVFVPLDDGVPLSDRFVSHSLTDALAE